jgi:hypothetical protein
MGATSLQHFISDPERNVNSYVVIGLRWCGKESAYLHLDSIERAAALVYQEHHRIADLGAEVVCQTTAEQNADRLVICERLPLLDDSGVLPR